MAHTQILVHRWRPKTFKDFGASLQTDFTRSLVSSVKQANWIDLKRITYTFA